MQSLLGTIAALGVASPGLLTTAHLAIVGGASIRYRDDLREDATGDASPVTFLIVVPAHNEELVLGASLDAINAARRTRDILLVVDDRSEDRTSEIARSKGARVLRREPHEAPGRAAARQAAIDHAAALEWDAMVMVDADSIVEPGFFDACELALDDDVAALQARSEAAIGNRLVDKAALASFAVQGVLLPRGRDRMGAMVRLRGTGMVLRRRIVETFAFRAPASEDLVFSLDLCLAGERVRHADRARLRSQNAGSWKAASAQKLRYEVGRMAAAREFAPRLLRQRTVAGLESGVFLLSPPFATAAALLLLGLGISILTAPTWVALTLVVALAVLAGTLVLAALEAQLTASTFAALLMAPAYLVWKVFIQLRAALTMRLGPREFGATPRH